MLNVMEYRDEKKNRTTSEVKFEFHDFTQEFPEKLWADVPPPDQIIFDRMPRPHKSPGSAKDAEHALSAGKALSSGKAQEEGGPLWPAREADEMIGEAERRAYALIQKAGTTADEYLSLAKDRADAIEAAARSEGFRKGFEEGFSEGTKKGLDEGQLQGYKEMADKYAQFFDTMEQTRASIDILKEEMLQQYLGEMRDLVLAIAQKVTFVSLESSGEVIKRMVLSAVEGGRDKQWGKVFISAADADKMKDDGIDLQKMVWKISDRIKIIVLPDAEAGSCVVEFPSQIIDAGIKTQMRRIKEIADDFDRGDGQEGPFVF